MISKQKKRMGNAASNSEEKQLLQTTEHGQRVKGNFLRAHSQSGRLIELGKKTSHPGALATFHFMAVCNDVIFVSNSSEGYVHRYCINSGKHLSAVKSKITSTELRGITVLRNRKVTSRVTIVVGDQGRKCLVALDVDMNGVIKYETSFANIQECCGLADNGYDEVYAADWAKHVVCIFKENSSREHDINFQFIRTISHTELLNPYCIAKHGKLLIVGQPLTASLLVFSDNGNFLNGLSYQEFIGKESPRGICADGDGKILIANGLGDDIHIINGNGNISQTLQDSEILHAKCIRDIAMVEEKIIILANINGSNCYEEVLIII